MPKLQWTEVDQVTTIWAESPPPFRAGLLFRTGRIDEILTTAGHTHLIEHLALSALDEPRHPYNGIVGGASTGFYTMGKSEDVVSFFEVVCNTLSSLPRDRLEGEKQVLAAENQARQYDLRLNLLVQRYGTTGYGQLGMKELGIPKATLEKLQEFTDQRFTKENAILWLSGPPPADLHLKLPNGVKQPLPPLLPVKQNFPCWVLDNACRGIGVGATVPRANASSPFFEIASRRLRQRLRTDQALSYAPSVFYDHLTADTAHLVLYADSDEEHRAELAKVFGEVFVELGEFEKSELETAKEHIRESWTGALAPPPEERLIVEAQRAAMDWILGKEYKSLESVLTEILSVTTDDLSAFADEMKATAMFALPGKAVLQSCFGEQAPLSTNPVVQGRVVQSVDSPINRVQLVHGPEGVSMIFPNNIHCTVLYSELAAALYYEDGCVYLIGIDDTTVQIEPTLWKNGKNICHQIRERVPANLVVDQLSRPANAIPKPTTSAWQRLYTRLTKR